MECSSVLIALCAAAARGSPCDVYCLEAQVHYAHRPPEVCITGFEVIENDFSFVTGSPGIPSGFWDNVWIDVIFVHGTAGALFGDFAGGTNAGSDPDGHFGVLNALMATTIDFGLACPAWVAGAIDASTATLLDGHLGARRHARRDSDDSVHRHHRRWLGARRRPVVITSSDPHVLICPNQGESAWEACHSG